MKKILPLIFIINLFYIGFAAAEFSDREYSYADYEWGFESKNPKKIFINIERSPQGPDYLLTRLIILNCNSENILEIIPVNEIVRPYEIKTIYLNTSLNSGNVCSRLKFKKSKFLGNPDPCINEKNKKDYWGEKMCRLKNNVTDFFENDRIPRGDAADKCSNKSKFKPSEVRAQYYRDCMKEEGY